MQLSSISLALNRRRATNPSLDSLVSNLFVSGEDGGDGYVQGAWYDPSGNNTTWRRNRLTYTQEFDNSAWTKEGLLAFGSGSVVDDIAAPDSTITADKLIENTSNSLHRVYTATNTAILNIDYTASIYVKSAGRRYFRLECGNSSVSRVAVFDLTTQSIVAKTNAQTSASIQDVGNGWYRCQVTGQTPNTTCFVICAISTVAQLGYDTYTGNGTDGFYLWGAQLEESSSASAYQRIITPEITYLSTVQAQPLLFQDSAGTLPVTEVEQPVGLMLDRRKGLALGPELVTNGDFSNGTTGWTLLTPGTSTVTVSSGQVTFQGGSTEYPEIKQTVLTIGKWYKATFTKITGSDASSMQLRFGDTTQIDIGGLAAGTYSVYGVATGTDFKLVKRGTSTSACTLDNISVKLLDGNHAYQTTSSARPHLRSRYNLLTYSEQFGTTWQVGNASISANSTTAPDSTTTADTFTATSGTSRKELYQTTTSAQIAANVAYSISVYVKKNTHDFFQITFWTGAGGASRYANFNVNPASAAVGTVGADATANLTSVGNGWYRCTLSATPTASGNGVSFCLVDSTSAASAADMTNAAGTESVYIWGAQLNLGSTAMSYQRIAAAPTLSQPPTYATVSTMGGEVFRPYLFFDGSDDSLQFETVTSTTGMSLIASATINNANNTGANTYDGTMVIGAYTGGVVQDIALSIRNNGTTTTASTYAETGSASVEARAGTYSLRTACVLYGDSNSTATRAGLNGSALVSVGAARNDLIVNRLGWNSTVGQAVKLDGTIYSVIAVGRVITDAERTSAVQYAANKAGVTL